MPLRDHFHTNPESDGLDTHYCSGDDIRIGDRVRCADWTGVIVFVHGTGYNPDWSYLGRGFMADYDKAGLVFSEQADEDLELVARAFQET